MNGCESLGPSLNGGKSGLFRDANRGAPAPGGGLGL